MIDESEKLVGERWEVSNSLNESAKKLEVGNSMGINRASWTILDGTK